MRVDTYNSYSNDLDNQHKQNQRFFSTLNAALAKSTGQLLSPEFIDAFTQLCVPNNNITPADINNPAKLNQLKQAVKDAIWLPGLSPAIKDAFIKQLIHLAQDLAPAQGQEATPSSSSSAASAQKAARLQATHLFAELKAILDDEKRKTQHLTAVSHQRAELGSAKQKDERNIQDYLDHQQPIPRNYWLKASDITPVLSLFEQNTQQNLVLPPIPPEGLNDAKQVLNASLKQGNHFVAVPVEAHGHWTLYYRNQNQPWQRFNPIGDGACGDRVLAKLAELLLPYAKSTRQAAQLPLVAHNASHTAVRKQTINLIQLNARQTLQNTKPSTIPPKPPQANTHTTPVVAAPSPTPTDATASRSSTPPSAVAIAARSQNTSNPTSGATSQDATSQRGGAAAQTTQKANATATKPQQPAPWFASSKLDKAFVALNNRALSLIEQIKNQPKEIQASKWNEFLKSISNNTSSNTSSAHQYPGLFSPTSSTVSKVGLHPNTSKSGSHKSKFADQQSQPTAPSVMA